MGTSQGDPSTLRRVAISADFLRNSFKIVFRRAERRANILPRLRNMTAQRGLCPFRAYIPHGFHPACISHGSGAELSACAPTWCLPALRPSVCKFAPARRWQDENSFSRYSMCGGSDRVRPFGFDACFGAGRQSLRQAVERDDQGPEEGSEEERLRQGLRREGRTCNDADGGAEKCRRDHHGQAGTPGDDRARTRLRQGMARSESGWKN